LKGQKNRTNFYVLKEALPYHPDERGIFFKVADARLKEEDSSYLVERTKNHTNFYVLKEALPCHPDERGIFFKAVDARLKEDFSLRSISMIYATAF